MRVTSKGQVTIPQAVRHRLGIEPGDEVEFSVRGDHAELRRAGADDRIETFLAAIRGSATSGLTTDEIMRMTRGDD